jgi:hypothetical protein
VPRPGPPFLPGARRRGPAGGRTPRRRMAPGIRHSPGRGAAGAAVNKEGKSEHGQTADAGGRVGGQRRPQALPDGWPRVALRKENRELGLQDAKLVAPWIAHDPEVVSALLLVAPPRGAE